MSISRYDHRLRYSTDPEAAAHMEELAEERAELRDMEGDPFGSMASRAEDRWGLA